MRDTQEELGRTERNLQFAESYQALERSSRVFSQKYRKSKSCCAYYSSHRATGISLPTCDNAPSGTGTPHKMLRRINTWQRSFAGLMCRQNGRSGGSTLDMPDGSSHARLPSRESSQCRRAARARLRRDGARICGTLFVGSRQACGYVGASVERLTMGHGV